MSKVINNLRLSQPNYMVQQVLDFVEKNKDAAVMKELIHYIETDRFRDPKKSFLMKTLFTEMVSLPTDLTPHFSTLLFQRPTRIELVIKKSCRFGRDIEMICYYEKSSFGTYNGQEMNIAFRMHRKRCEDLTLCVTTPAEWPSTPITGRYIFQDEYSCQGRVKTPNTTAPIVKEILLAHLPKEIRNILDKLQHSNKWEHTLKTISPLLYITINTNHIPIKLNVDIKSNSNDQLIVFTRKL